MTNATVDTRKRHLSIFDATMIAEGSYELAGYDADEVDADLVHEAWQELVDTGVVWSLQGYFGRTAHSLIQQGIIQPAARDKTE